MQQSHPQLQLGQGPDQWHAAAAALPLTPAPATPGEPAFHQLLKKL